MDRADCVTNDENRDTGALDWGALDPHVEALLRRYRAPGLGVAVTRRGALEFGKSFGYRDVASRRPVTLDTVFPVASVTKSFTALAIMQLQETRRLAVTDPVIRYLPEFRTPDPRATPRITIHHFLTHTAGLPPLRSRWFAFARDVARDWNPADVPVRLDSRPPIDTHEQLMEFMAETPWTLLGPPGALMSYSNEGYALLGAIIERITGLSYAQYIRQHILTPLLLRHTTFDTEMPAEGLELTSLYTAGRGRNGDDVSRAPRWWTSNVWLAASGICSSVGDLVRYLDVFRAAGTHGGDTPVSPSAIQDMLRPHVQISPRKAYGYGFELTEDYNAGVVASHAGGRLGGSSHVLVMPHLGVAAAGLANFEDIPVWVATHGALHLLLGLSFGWRPAPYPRQVVPRSRLKTYVGDYRGYGDRSMRVAAVADGLTLETDGHVYDARPISRDAFAISEAESEQYVKFLVDPRGRSWAVAHGLVILQRMNDSVPPGLRLARSMWRQIRSRSAGLWQRRLTRLRTRGRDRS
jgi:CubicO group peptidase (beta-lactamase class C family)